MLTGLVLENRYEGVALIEFRRGVWESGQGHTDVLRFYVRGGAAPVVLDGLSCDGARSFPRLRKILDAAKEEREPALGRFLAERVGVPYAAVEERIPDPPSD